MQSESIPLRPAWVEVNLQAIENNARRLKDILGRDTELMAMVKANAYGHGAIETARAAWRGGATWLGVYAAGEGIELRRAGIAAPILVVGPTLNEWMPGALAHNLTLAIFSFDHARALADIARVQHTRARVHVKVNTGMTRLGIEPEQANDFVRAIRDLGNLELEGVFTHFAVADETREFSIAYTREQLSKFNRVVDEFERAGIRVRYRHAANSPASVRLPDARFNLARCGILIYGLDPSDEVARPEGFAPALSFKTRVAQVRAVPAGTYVSYGCAFRTERASRLAVLMVGYADGFRRKPNYGAVLVRGARAPIVGRVCMDQTMIDVTDIDGVTEGDEVVLIGKQGAEEITAEHVARNLGTNNYETTTTISARVERRYV
ncbi:MAG: alanine racemase [Chloroflexi bacterium]|nr:alanine racemase [Chloroflexota bacterium]